MRKLLFLAALAALSAGTASAQLVQSRSTGSVNEAVVMVPTTGKAYPSDTSSELKGVVLVDSATGSPYAASGGGASSTAAKSFRQTCTTSAVQMASNTLSNGAVIKALSTNAGTAYIGPAGVTTATGYPLAAGEAISYGVANSSQLYLICSDALSVIAVTGN